MLISFLKIIYFYRLKNYNKIHLINILRLKLAPRTELVTIQLVTKIHDTKSHLFQPLKYIITSLKQLTTKQKNTPRLITFSHFINQKHLKS